MAAAPRDADVCLLLLMDTWDHYQRQTPEMRARIDAERLVPVPELFEMLRAELARPIRQTRTRHRREVAR